MKTSLLTEEQISQIHDRSLVVLERVGVTIPHPEILGRFADCGARVDFTSQRVQIPAGLVLRSLSQAGKRFTVYGRDESLTAAFGDGSRNYNGNGGETWWVDDIAGERRHGSLQDVITAARFGDALKHVNIVGALAYPHEISPPLCAVETMAALLRGTNKPFYLYFDDRISAKYIVEMMIAVRGDERRASEFPLGYVLLCPISPLHFPFNGIDVLFETARLNLGVHVSPMPQMGLSSPCTVAGTIVQENAEILAGVCVTQLIRPGMPVCYGGIPHAFDMNTSQLIFSGPEEAIFGVAMTQIGKHYGLPVYINVGLADAKRPDAQAGVEIAATLVLGAAAGADIFGHLGISGSDQASSLDMLVLQDEVISYTESVLREVDFSEEALAVKEIEEVGPGGNYLARDFTATHFRQELWFPKLFDRHSYPDWQEKGASSMEERCRRRKKEILRKHVSSPIDQELERTLKEFVADVKRSYQ